MFDWLKRLLGGGPKRAASTPPPSPDGNERPFGRGGPIQYQPMITSWRRAGGGALGDRHVILLCDNLKAVGRIEYAYMLVVVDRRDQCPVLFVASEVNAMAGVLGGGSHVLGVFDVGGHANLGFSNDWGDATKFFPRAIEVAARKFGVDPASVRVALPGKVG